MARIHQLLALVLILLIAAPGFVWAADEEEIEPDPLPTVPAWMASLWERLVESITTASRSIVSVAAA